MKRFTIAGRIFQTSLFGKITSNYPSCSNRLEGINLQNKTSILGENHKAISRVKQFRNKNELNRKLRNKKSVTMDNCSRQEYQRM